MSAAAGDMDSPRHACTSPPGACDGLAGESAERERLLGENSQACADKLCSTCPRAHRVSATPDKAMSRRCACTLPPLRFGGSDCGGTGVKTSSTQTSAESPKSCSGPLPLLSAAAPVGLVGAERPRGVKRPAKPSHGLVGQPSCVHKWGKTGCKKLLPMPPGEDCREWFAERCCRAL